MFRGLTFKIFVGNKMSSRQDIRDGRGGSRRTPIVKVDPLPPASQESKLPTLVLPNAKKICSIVLFFIGSFAIGFGAGFGTGYASKECV